MVSLRERKAAKETLIGKPAGSPSEPENNTVEEEGALEGEKNDTDTKSGNQAGDGLSDQIGVDLNKKYGESSTIENQRPYLNLNEEDDDGGTGDGRKFEFLVGDFIWGKIKSHPWWPGQIFDPSDASELASNSKQSDGLLVAYFGDGSCAWCLPSQLVPFTEHFEEFSKQSTSKRFVNAVDKALEEISRLAELKMTCSCLPEENRDGLSRPQAMNAGVRPGVLVPEGDIERLALPNYEPAEVLKFVRHLAQAGSPANELELMVVKSWLSAFYRVKRGSRLPVYHEPKEIEGLEDKSKLVVSDTNDFSIQVEVPTQGPLEEGRSSLLKAGPLLSDEKPIQRRKHKSVAELMVDNTNDKPKHKKKSTSGDELPSTTVQTKEKANPKAINERATLHASTTGRKRGQNKNNEISAVNDEVQPEIEVSKRPLQNLATKNVDNETKDESEKSPLSRERKKSKYLSPPFISPARKSLVRSGSEKFEKVARVGEPMTEAAGRLNVSPIVKCDGATSGGETCEEHPSGLETPGQKEKKIIDVMDVNESGKEVLAEVQRAGVDLRSLNTGSIEMIKRFITAFRSSVFLNGSNYKSYLKQRPERKRKSSAFEPRNKSNERSRSRVVKLRKSPHEVDEKASLVSLVVSFPPGASLPSEDELIRTFSIYGNLNEDQTKSLLSSNSAEVAFLSISDAEKAFNEAVKNSPFSVAEVSYRLRYSSSDSGALESDQTVSTSLKKRMLKTSTGLELTDKEKSQVGFIRQQIEMLTSMLEECNGKVSAEDKSSIESEIRSLLEKISALAVQTSA